mgnify:CR=1 FL=1
MRLTMFLLAAFSVSGSMCASPGDFCDLGIRMETEKENVALYLLEHDRALLVDMNVNNKMLDRCK